MEPKRILLIEDDEFIRDLYVTELTSAGLVVDSFGTGREGIKAIDENHYDLALLDIMLPDTNGLEILKHIKSSSKSKDTKCVMLSNLGQEEVIKEGFALGAQGYMIKVSYNPDQVVEEVKNFLSGKVGTPPQS